MAKNEAKIKFSAETSDFNQAIKDANSELTNLRAEMKLNEAQFVNSGDAVDYNRTKQELLEASLEANRNKQEALSDKLEVAKNIYGESSNEVQNLERQLTYAQIEEQKLMSQVGDTNNVIDDQSKAAETAGDSVESMTDILVNAGVADCISNIASAAADMAQEFDSASAAIVEGTGASGEALDGLNLSARNALGAIANADADIGSVSDVLAELNTRFGITGETATDITTKVMNFSQHTGTDGVNAVDSIANVMKRWNLDITDVDELLDDLTTANQSCQLSVDNLTGYLTNNSTQFKELGYSTQDALAMLISLSDGGANVSSIMSGLTKAVSNLSDTTTNVPAAFRESIDIMSQCDSVSEALQKQVGDTGLTIEDVFGKKAAQELITNVQNGSFAIENWTSVLQNNSGALQDTTANATTMQDAWSQATNNVSMALGSTFSPVISDVIKKVSDVITKTSQVVQKTPAVQACLVSVTVALIALATALGISSAISMVQKAFALLNTTMLSNPIFIVVTAIAALAAGIVYAYKKCEIFRNVVNSVFAGIYDIIVSPVLRAKNGIKAVIDDIKNLFHVEFPTLNIKTPHFAIKPEGWTAGDLLKGKIPEIKVDWYAKGAIFTSPTIMPTASGFKGVGEAGPEAVAPISVLQNYIYDAVLAASAHDEIDYERLGKEIAKANAKNQQSIILNGRELGRAVREVL